MRAALGRGGATCRRAGDRLLYHGNSAHRLGGEWPVAFVTDDASHYSTALIFHNFINSATEDVMTDPPAAKVIKPAPEGKTDGFRVSLSHKACQTLEEFKQRFKLCLFV